LTVPTAAKSESEFERFKNLTERVMSVPKSKIDAREVKYRDGRKAKNRKRHR
jgi:hypothetical protein